MLHVCVLLKVGNSGGYKKVVVEAKLKVAINGFGRIGRNFLRCWHGRKESPLDVIPINDTAPGKFVFEGFSNIEAFLNLSQTWSPCHDSSWTIHMFRPGTTRSRSWRPTQLTKRSCVRKRPSWSCAGTELAEPEKANADKAAEVILLRKALEAADHRATTMGEEAAPSVRQRGGRGRSFEDHGGHHGTYWLELRPCRSPSRSSLRRSTSFRSI
ncbi:hypothetical protein ACSQ67_008835 [Phaseolus vulgaris]